MSRSYGTTPWYLSGPGQVITSTSSSQASSAVQAQTREVYITCTAQNVRIATGQNSPAATATSMLVKVTDPPLLVAVRGGDSIAVIQDTVAGGIVTIFEVTR